jgi:hypothetical protein
MCEIKDRGIAVGVDGNDQISPFDTNPMLDCP